ncbi:MAG TPA: porin family protein [Gallionellaceae bacterium]
MKKTTIIALLSAFIALPANAAGGYVGVSLGSGQIDISGLNSTTSLGFFGGYSFNENFSAEIAYYDFGSQDLAPGFTLKSSALSMSGVGFLPINEQFSLFAKLGFASTSLDLTGFSTESNTDFTYGFGGQINVNPQFAIRAGYDVYKVGSGVSVDQKLMSVGGLLRF